MGGQHPPRAAACRCSRLCGFGLGPALSRSLLAERGHSSSPDPQQHPALPCQHPEGEQGGERLARLQLGRETPRPPGRLGFPHLSTSWSLSVPQRHLQLPSIPRQQSKHHPTGVFAEPWQRYFSEPLLHPWFPSPSHPGGVERLPAPTPAAWYPCVSVPRQWARQTLGVRK